MGGVGRLSCKSNCVLCCGGLYEYTCGVGICGIEGVVRRIQSGSTITILLDIQTSTTSDTNKYS